MNDSMPVSGPSQRNRILRETCVLVILVIGFLLLVRNTVSGDPYLYDEADYAYAVERGPLINGFETNTIPIWRLVQVGLDRGHDKTQRIELSEWLRKSGDISFYRHWHGPLMFYYLMAVDANGATELFNREAMLAFPLLTLIVIWYGCLRLLPKATKVQGAVLTTSLVSWHYVSITSSEIAPHQLFALTFILSLILLALALHTGRQTYWYASVAAAALAFVTMELAFVLVIVLAIAAWKERFTLSTNKSMIARSSVLFASVAVLIWPAALLRLSFVKGYLLHVYMAVFRKAVWGEVTLADTWKWRLTHNPVHWALLLIAVFLFFRMKGHPIRKVAWPFLAYGFLMLLLVAGVATVTPRYDLPFAQAFDVFTGLILTAMFSRFERRLLWLMAVGIASLCFVSTSAAKGTHVNSPSRASQVLETVRRQGLEAKRLLVPHDDLPVLHYYFPKATLRPYTGSIPAAADLNDYDAVITTGFPVHVEWLHR